MISSGEEGRPFGVLKGCMLGNARYSRDGGREKREKTGKDREWARIHTARTRVDMVLQAVESQGHEYFDVFDAPNI